MTPLRWSVRILGGSLFFVAALWAAAPASANHIDQDIAVAAGCHIFGKAIGVEKFEQLIHLSRYEELVADDKEFAFYIGYAEGYAQAASEISGIPIMELAAAEYRYSCEIETI